MPDLQLDWFTHDRLGLFVHWGLYALGARHERLMNRERIQTKTYARYACQTLNGSWGYFRDNQNDKPVDLLVRMLIDGVSKNGNLLLNVGPTARGNFDPRAVRALQGIGDWMDLHARSIYGATASPFTPPTDVRYTQQGNRLYVHIFSWPLEHLHLPDLAGKVEYAQLLNDASEIGFRVIDPAVRAQNTGVGGQPAGTLTLTLPIRRPEVAVPVVELFLSEPQVS